MKIIRGLKIGGLQQKIFNLLLVFILALVGIYAGIYVMQQRNLKKVVAEANEEQQEAIAAISEETMRSVIDASMAKATALQAYIADDLFADVRSDVLTLQAFATQLFENADQFSAHAFAPPDAANDGIPSVQMQTEEGVDPDASRTLGLAANMSEIMLAMYSNSDKLSSCFVATADGCILFVDDRSGSYVAEDGTVYPFAVRERPWYTQAATEGELIFTGVEEDAFTGIRGLVCAAPVYSDGELVAVVGADIFLTSIEEYVNSTASEGSFVCVIGEDGKVLFSPEKAGVFAAGLSSETSDLRENENTDLAAFVRKALLESTGVEQIAVEDKTYYLSGEPLHTVGWAVISAADKAVTDQPKEMLLAQYDAISENAETVYGAATRRAVRVLILLTVLIILGAIAAALLMAHRIVRPLEKMTKRINSLKGSDILFEMEDTYRTDDEIEILAESFASLSKKTTNYIEEITRITAEKERIGTELALATRIQADMLPNIYPAFPDRPEIDVFGTMKPAKEVGGDFFDYFLVDDDHLCVVIADVSGKGVPAALFMMASKIMLSNHAMQGKSPAKILEDTNEAICANNREEMFITVWLGILEISSGRLTAANAGHEYPVLYQPGGQYELIKDKHGFVIGGMAGMRYKDYEIALEKGARIFVYTDGVPEATSAEKELFGTTRMVEALNRDLAAPIRTVLENVDHAVNDFVKDAEQFDDMTMLCLEYKGKE